MIKQLYNALRKEHPETKKANDAVTASLSQAAQENSVASRRVMGILCAVTDGPDCLCIKPEQQA